MQRRSLLVGATASLAGLAGCATDGLSDDTDSAAESPAESETDTADDSGLSDDALANLDEEDVVEFANFDPAVNEAFVGIVADPPVDEIVLTTSVADEKKQVRSPDGDELYSVPVDHQGDTLSVVVRLNESETEIYEDRWSPPTADDFDEEILDEDSSPVEDVEIIEEEMGYTAQVNFGAEIDATEIRINSTVARGAFRSDTEGLRSGTVQINGVEDEVTVATITNGDEEIVHREHLQP